MKIIKLIFVIIILLSVLFLGGAYLLPENQKFVKTIEVKADPVASFSRLSDPVFIEKICKLSLTRFDYSYELLSAKEFDEIKYRYISENSKNDVYIHFYIDQAESGTGITCSMELDSLGFPLGRWYGFFTAFIHKNDFQKGLDTLEKEILK